MKRPVSPWDILGVEMGASDEEIHRAFLRATRKCPPDRDPEGFERIRDAYEKLKNGISRFNAMIELVSKNGVSIKAIARNAPRPTRTYLGPKVWLDVIKNGI